MKKKIFMWIFSILIILQKIRCAYLGPPVGRLFLLLLFGYMVSAEGYLKFPSMFVVKTGILIKLIFLYFAGLAFTKSFWIWFLAEIRPKKLLFSFKSNKKTLFKNCEFCKTKNFNSLFNLNYSFTVFFNNFQN